MVFSFFKKTAEKMPERAPARPKAIVADVPASSAPVAAPQEASRPEAEEEDWDLDFSSANTEPNGAYGIEIREEGDPFAELAEHAAILFANGQDEGARSALESSLQNNADPGALRLWAMLFDLLRLKGDRAAFDARGLEFARTFELSPPSWALEPAQRSVAGKLSTTGAVLQGVLGGDDPVFEVLETALGAGQSRSLELGRLAGLDNQACGRLATLLRKARQKGLAWQLVDADGLAGRLDKRVQVGQTQNENFWIALLELYQYLGWDVPFEERAVDYAVTFEVSPPSWDPSFRTSVLSPVPDDHLEAENNFCLTGDVLQGNLQGLAEHLNISSGGEIVLDFSRVSRLDFVSAGALVNLLKSVGAGVVIIHHPNRLVAELLHVMGIDSVARVEISKN